MDMDREAKTALLTSLICVALSSGTVYAATDDATVYGKSSVPQGMVYYDLAGKQSKKAAPQNTPSDKQLAGQDPSQDLRARMRWEAVASSEPQPQTKAVVKPQPIIITAQDVRRQQKAARRALRDRDKRAAQNDSGTVMLQPRIAGQPLQPRPALPGQNPAAGQPGQTAGSLSGGTAAQPAAGAPAGSPPAVIGQPHQGSSTAAPAQPAPSRPAAPGLSGTPLTPGDEPRRPLEQSPQQRAMAQRPRDEQLPPPPAHPSGPQTAAQPGPEQTAPAPEPHRHHHHHHRRHIRPYQPAPGQPPQLRRDTPRVVASYTREPEFAGISNEVYRHIKAGIYAMTMQLSQEPTEHGVFQLTKVLCANEKLTHLQKIDYLIGFGWAINHSRLSDWQKGAFIDAVLQAFE